MFCTKCGNRMPDGSKFWYGNTYLGIFVRD